MYEKLKQLIHDLEAMNRQPFIGYGKPDADILIVGRNVQKQRVVKIGNYSTPPTLLNGKKVLKVTDSVTPTDKNLTISSTAIFILFFHSSNNAIK